MIVYERFESTAMNGPETHSYRATTRDCPYLLALSALFKTGPQNRVRAATFAE